MNIHTDWTDESESAAYISPVRRLSGRFGERGGRPSGFGRRLLSADMRYVEQLALVADQTCAVLLSWRCLVRHISSTGRRKMTLLIRKGVVNEEWRSQITPLFYKLCFIEINVTRPWVIEVYRIQSKYRLHDIFAILEWMHAYCWLMWKLLGWIYLLNKC